jgi:hypothetical protein
MIADTDVYNLAIKGLFIPSNGTYDVGLNLLTLSCFYETLEAMFVVI